MSRAAADQRRGRAGRTEPGVCYRLWEEAATGALEPFGRPEILSADLAPLVLDCAAWGVADPRKLAFLDPPPAPALAEARALLVELGALDRDGRITDDGARAARAARCRRGSPAWSCRRRALGPSGAGRRRPRRRAGRARPRRRRRRPRASASSASAATGPPARAGHAAAWPRAGRGSAQRPQTPKQRDDPRPRLARKSRTPSHKGEGKSRSALSSPSPTRTASPRRAESPARS